MERNFVRWGGGKVDLMWVDRGVARGEGEGVRVRRWWRRDHPRGVKRVLVLVFGVGVGVERREGMRFGWEVWKVLIWGDLGSSEEERKLAGLAQRAKRV